MFKQFSLMIFLLRVIPGLNTTAWLLSTRQVSTILVNPKLLNSANRGLARTIWKLNIFSRICGDDTLKKVVIVTTKWDTSTTNEFYEEREESIKDAPWRPLIDKGSTIERFNYTQVSAWQIVGKLLHSFTLGILAGELEIALQIQKELVDNQKFFPETEAGKQVLDGLKNAINKQEMHCAKHEMVKPPTWNATLMM
ncbi:hypothetical protein CPB84DRAFT_1748975 [Gymnopilus junonius]|uniref:Uncharacterized protein n=1 Tax=Gymnopilus junonius TaxID=109634 RepID=A0A9P5NKN3_GYMJU|nr:hypothetical protein CPB84DRAFT_1748975 [Gymnopilus junonius]